MARKTSLLLATVSAAALVGATLPAGAQLASAPAPPHVVSLSIAQDSVVRSATRVAVSFNVPMDLPSVRYAATLVLAQGNQAGGLAKWKVMAPLSAQPVAGGRTVVLGLAHRSRPLPGGAYSLVIGPAAESASGTAMMYASVTDFVVAPDRSLWETVTVGTERYDVWAVTTGAAGPARDDQYLVEGARGTVLTGGQHVLSVYATDYRGRLVTNNALSSQLEAYAEEDGWLRLQRPSLVPGALELDPNTVTWATDNGPNSALGDYLYGLAKSLGEDVATPPSQADVDDAELATALADEGPPGTWASELASDKSALDMAQTATKGYVLAQQLTTLLSEGTLSLPGADAAKAMLHVLKVVNGAANFSLGTLQELYQAEWEASQAAAEAGPLRAIASALPSSDAFMASDISGLLHFSLASEQAAIARAAASYATNQAYGLSADVAKELAADSDPVAAAVVAGLDIGFFIASFTGWDKLRAAFYQAVEQADAERAMVDAAQALETSIASTPAPTPGQLDGALLAWRLARNTMADFYAACIAIVHLDQWGQAVDSHFAGLEALVGVHPAADNVASWRSNESFDRRQASGLVPGLAQASGDAALAAVATRFPTAPAHAVPFSLCGTVISEPGQYVLPVSSLVSDLSTGYAPNCSVPGLRLLTGVDIAAPGVSLDLNGHAIFMASSDVGVWLGQAAAGSVVSNGTVGEGAGCCFGMGVVDLASGAMATRLQVLNERMAFLAAGTDYSRFVGNIVSPYGGQAGTSPWSDLGAGPVPGMVTVSYGGVSLDRADNTTVARDTLQGGTPGDVGIVLLGSSGNRVEDNSVLAAGNAIYAGCNGFVANPPAHPLTHTTCKPSTGNEITGNHLTMTAAGPLGPAIALDSSTAGNVVVANHVAWQPYHDFPLWDYNRCGVNTWRSNIVSPNPAATDNLLSNWPCVR